MSLEFLENSKRESIIFLAPMADVNDYSFRKLCRQNGVSLCWTGFINAHHWVTRTKQRDRDVWFTTRDNEKNLVVQLLGSNLEELVSCAKDVENFCDMIELNCGCTHCFASRSGCGFFLIDTQKHRDSALILIQNLIKSINKPVSIKIRLISDDNSVPSLERTVKFAQDLERVGVSLITVHARTQQADKKGDVDYDAIKAVVQAVSVPVIANGGISSLEQAQEIIQRTGAYAVMAGQCFFKNPTCLTTNKNPKEISLEYLNLAKENNEDLQRSRKHVYAFLGDVLRQHPEYGPVVMQQRTYVDLIEWVKSIEI
ncbi:hypothetical protein TVAG_021320 [Trichomonas vaginalis G3]|uniref:DUS-like FMN-binding domain-containing protein n=1 Tax=Trichomonas vaginalis (strain ATCC PRA-98 / G3) TaxID=412133 RepID=A2DHB4_TRIV3|nr:tRNA dihydrouridine synthase protein [Trichomonas vaginalis G3]EAY20187.1 hypothetical protein TVAG_021320 [Trichomonas vaginalis G3]KAI5507666.1 tRNA dihydrouridine synthase protein [Trichomonas vaginalis G3]|eukprot:XP_001581173.1 hypothetical protein [Trichomonas vaginalis G3]